METDGQRAPKPEFATLFDTIEFPEAYRITYLAGAIAGPAYEAIKREFGLIRAEYVLLVCLAHFDELTAQDVANISRRPRNTVSRAVHRMVAEGLILRAPDATDGRQARLRITDAGRALQKQAARHLQDRQIAILGGLDQDERELFSKLLRKAARHAASLGD